MSKKLKFLGWSPICKFKIQEVHMNAVGIDVSKGKSMVCVMRQFGEVVASPFEVAHTVSELRELASSLKSLNGETKVVMECTGAYHLPIARALHTAGFFVSTLNPQLTHGFGNNTIRKRHSDKADSVKIANYGLTNWLELPKYVPQEEIRQSLKSFSRQYNKYNKGNTMLTNTLISLLDQTFPGLKEMFTSPSRESDGHEKWLDFAARFWHCECVGSISLNAFTEAYRKWCKRSGYYCVGADEIHALARQCAAVMPKNEITKLLITHAVTQVNAVVESLAVNAREMKRLAEMLPEYPVVLAFRGVGKILGPQLIAEIGDIRRFPKKSSLVCFAGLEPTDNQSGKFQGDEAISKQGSPHLRKALFQVMDCLLKHSPVDDPVYQLLDRKRAEKKHYYCYMNAGAAKFLRIYYARVTQYLNSLEA
jgi:transposase